MGLTRNVRQYNEAFVNVSYVTIFTEPYVIFLSPGITALEPRRLTTIS